jgi:hypothetical protein
VHEVTKRSRYAEIVSDLLCERFISETTQLISIKFGIGDLKHNFSSESDFCPYGSNIKHGSNLREPHRECYWIWGSHSGANVEYNLLIVMTYSSVGIHRYFRAIYSLHFQGRSLSQARNQQDAGGRQSLPSDPDDGSDSFLLNVGGHLFINKYVDLNYIGLPYYYHLLLFEKLICEEMKRKLLSLCASTLYCNVLSLYNNRYASKIHVYQHQW